MTYAAPLMEYLRALEGKDNRSRGEEVLKALSEIGVKPDIQESRILRLKNIGVRFSPELTAKRLIFSAHYDAAEGSPGANDNASGVAVLLGLCRELAGSRAPATVIFFDREEPWLRTPVFCLGLLGSFYYTLKTNLHDLSAVYNLEFCGAGEVLAIWSVKDSVKIPALKKVREAALGLSLPVREVYVPWLLLGSDHLSFRLKGMANSVTLSLLPSAQVPALEEVLRNLSIWKLLPGYRPELPEPLSFIHSPLDTSSRLSEVSLGLMLSLLMELIKLELCRDT